MKKLLISLVLATSGLAGSSADKPPVASSSADGIELTVRLVEESLSRTLIKCVLRNESKHILAATFARSKSMAFRFFLKDPDGNIVPMLKPWALSHSQPDGTNDSVLDRRSLQGIYLRPGDSSSFDFYLEDAYGQRAEEGKELTVKWMNIFSKPGGIIHIDEVKNTEGTITPAYQEENHFPGLREFAVTLPLAGDLPVTVDEPPVTTPEQAKPNPSSKPATPIQSQNQVQPTASNPFDFRWLLLFLLPGIILLRRCFLSRRVT